MKKGYTGGCQCGKVRYEAQADIGEVIISAEDGKVLTSDLKPEHVR